MFAVKANMIASDTHVMARSDEKKRDRRCERDWRLLTRYRLTSRAFAAVGYVPLLVHHAPANVYMQYHLATSGILAEPHELLATNFEWNNAAKIPA